MNRARDTHFVVAGWRFLTTESTPRQSAGDHLIENVVAALEGKRGAPFRRSRHATTWKVRITRAAGESANIFVKQLDAARGLIARAKSKSRAKRSAHVLRISQDLRRRRFGVPSVLLVGENRNARNEVIVTSEAPGFMLTRWMNPTYHTEVEVRRAILNKLGAEIARLHRAGYIHGDLTPYNVFATGTPQIAITFIDHEGTERTSPVSINVARNRMRNLVQLGHFDIPGVSRTDKLRVFAAYASALGQSEPGRRQSLVRVAKMIEQRRRRDRAIRPLAAQSATITRKRAAGG